MRAGVKASRGPNAWLHKLQGGIVSLGFLYLGWLSNRPRGSVAMAIVESKLAAVCTSCLCKLFVHGRTSNVPVIYYRSYSVPVPASYE